MKTKIVLSEIKKNCTAMQILINPSKMSASNFATTTTSVTSATARTTTTTTTLIIIQERLQCTRHQKRSSKKVECLTNMNFFFAVLKRSSYFGLFLKSHYEELSKK